METKKSKGNKSSENSNKKFWCEETNDLFPECRKAVRLRSTWVDVTNRNRCGVKYGPDECMNIKTCVIIGSGNVATHLAKAFAPYLDIVQVYSRKLQNARELAQKISPHCKGVNRPEDIYRYADLYIMAVTDDSIKPILEAMKDLDRGLWVHTSGSVPMGVFYGYRTLCGVLYPLQTFSKSKEVDMSQVPFYIEGDDTDIKKALFKLAKKISRSVVGMSSENRRRLHASSVFACNFVNYMWAVADRQLRMCGTDIHALDPLLKETIEKISTLSPEEAQTGPARRGDRNTMECHLSMLGKQDRELYELISKQIFETYHPGEYMIFDRRGGGSDRDKDIHHGTAEYVESVAPQLGYSASQQYNDLGMSKIDYDLSKIRAFVFDIDGVLSPATVPMGEDGMPMRMVNVKDGYAIQLAVKHGYKFAIITGGYSDALALRYKALGVNDVYMGSSMKLPVLKKWMEENGLEPEQVVYVGDDIPDHDCMRYVGLGVAPEDADVGIKKVARYISPVKGGYGVGRDVIEEVMKAQGEWMSTEKAFGW